MQQRSTFFDQIPFLDVGDVIVLDHEDPKFESAMGMRIMKDGIRVLIRRIRGRTIARRVE